MIEFNKIIEQTDLYNFHTHTQFCDGHASMNEFVDAAIANGFKFLGFTPHSPIPFDTSCNMKHSDVINYKTEFDKLKAANKDRIELFYSMEIDYIDKNWNAQNEYFKDLSLDYKLSSVHFIPSFDDKTTYVDVDGRYPAFKEKMNKYFHNDIKSVVESFYKQTLDMIEIGGFDIIGHFDKIGHNASHFEEGIEEQEWYNNIVNNVFEAIIDNKLIIEINTKALMDHNRFFPNKRFFKMLKQANAPILINSDCHYPKLMNAGRVEAFNLLSQNF